MASMKAEKPVGTQLFGQAKKEPVKAGESSAKATALKPGSLKPSLKKAAAQKPQETKKKGKGGKGSKATAK